MYSINYFGEKRKILVLIWLQSCLGFLFSGFESSVERINKLSTDEVTELVSLTLSILGKVFIRQNFETVSYFFPENRQRQLT